jgi:hypothetical protein
MSGNPPPTVANKILDWMKNSWWQGVAAVVSILALLVALPAACEKPLPPSNNGIRDGSCNVQGSGTANCNLVPPPRSLGVVSLNLSDIETAFFAGPKEALPVPPKYAVREVTSHCDDWADWLTSDSRIFLNPQLQLSMQAGEDDLVVVKRVRAEVFVRKSKVSGVILGCKYGGDRGSGYSININTASGKTTFFDLGLDEDEGQKEFSMPPSTINLSAKGYEEASISIDSQEGYLYEGRLAVIASVNGNDKEYSYGSESNPFRWYESELPGTDDFLDWHPIENRWTGDMDAYGILMDDGYGQDLDPEPSISQR